ncbi:hypothetical protein [Cupriavidus pauculus]|uniref:hypothetical protein n=1 Tax=Cupriavidus pauculus TaxID=82633 RepID=UPI0012469767|nr:hypothetical protein [Cupriavidus pauculus]KAB0594711.1 hypothetical protein F7R19_29210 [Cupriavidus pauculus]UAK98486.1 hypothetical protein K8O84_10645 [Cupriavidus pauculus]
MLNFILYAAALGAVLMVFEKIFATPVGIAGLLALIAGVATLYFTIKSHRESLADGTENTDLSFRENFPAFSRIRYPIFLVVGGLLGISLGIVKSNRQEAEIAQKNKEFETMAQSYIDTAIKENCKYQNSNANLAQLNKNFGDVQTQALGENAMLHTAPGTYQRAGDLSKQAENEYKSAIRKVVDCESEQRAKVYDRLRKERQPSK